MSASSTPELDSTFTHPDAGQNEILAINTRELPTTTPEADGTSEVDTGVGKRKRVRARSMSSNGDGGKPADSSDDNERTEAVGEEAEPNIAKQAKKKVKKEGGKEKVKKAPKPKKEPKGRKGKPQASEPPEIKGEQDTGMTTPPPEGEGASIKCEAGSAPKKMKKSIWDPAEDAIIVQLYGEKKTYKEIAVAVNKLKPSVEVDAMMVNNRWNNTLKHMAITWLDEEVETLKKFHAAIVKDPYTALAERMNKEYQGNQGRKFTKQSCEKKIKEVVKKE